MDTLKFIHAADFHLDTPFSGLSAQQGAQRRRESRELLFRLADYVNEQDVQLVLLAGDLFDSANNAYRETTEQLVQALGQMQAQVFIAPGNHDWYGTGSPWLTAEWSENVHIFQKAALTAVELPEWDLVIHGGAFTAAEQSESLLTGFHVPEDGKLHIGLLHGEIDPSDHRYHPISREDVAGSGLDYLALGHIHKRTAPFTLGKTLCAWSGCLEGRGFDELGEKGFYLGTIRERQISLEFVPFARRRYEMLEVDVTGKSPRTAVEAALAGRDTRGDFYRILLTGETDEKGVGALTELLQDQFYGLEIRDHTRLAEDVWKRQEDLSLRGLFLQELRKKWEAADTEEERELITKAARYGLAALDHRDLG